MRAGELRHQVRFQKKTIASDGLGSGGTETYADKYRDQAAIWPLKANQMLESMKLTNVITHKIRIRYRSGITNDMRIKHDSKCCGHQQTFDIVSIINSDERNIMLEILATERI